MLGGYVNSSIIHSRERARILKGKIPNPDIAVEFRALQTLCEQRIDDTIEQLDYLLSDPGINRPELAREKLRMYRRALFSLSRLETRGIVALTRIHPDDIVMNGVVNQIHREIRYPLSPPTVSCFSQGYYWIDHTLNLLAIPAAESDSLLHLPDLYHEMAHLLITAENNPKVEKFQCQLIKLYEQIDKHFEYESTHLTRSTGPKEALRLELELIRKSWIDWAVEIFCDLYALYTIGPAYAWAHLHLCTQLPTQPHAISLDETSSHPPDQARMETLLNGLRKIGYGDDAKLIEDQWNQLLSLCGSSIDSTYLKACPDDLLECAVECSLKGTSEIGSRIAHPDVSDNIHRVLNDAWKVFWERPSGYLDWEREQIKTLKSTYGP
jgi:hypothetical protein